MSNVLPRIARSLRVVLAVALLGSAVTGCEHFPEATFELANESRLPVWFNLPPGLDRGDVSVTMNYYVKPGGRTATFILHDSKGHTLAKIDGELRGNEPLHLKSSPQTDAAGYPSYEVVTAHGVAEVIEHKHMEPIFYVIDNRAVWTELLGVQPGKNAGH